MPAWQTRIWAALLGLHLILVFVISLEDLSWTLVYESNSTLKLFCRQVETVTSTLLARRSSQSHRWREAITTYADCTGIEAGYSYFAPSVPGNCRLSFELHYPDGRVEYDLPPVGGAAAGYRVSALLDHLQRIHYLRLRGALVETLAYSVQKEHPQTEMVRASMSVAKLPTPAQYRAGSRISYQLLYSYTFRFRSTLPLGTPR